jgi:thymidylate kinase
MQSIRNYLRSVGYYIVLRNHDIRKNLQSGGDLDVLVGDLDIARLLLVQHFGNPLFSVRRSYVEGHFYSWGHIDLTPRIEWRGAVYIDNSVIFDSAEVSDFGLKKPRLAHEALICWFSSLLWGGFFKERYASIIEQAANDDGECFLQSLTHSVGDKLGARLFSLALQGQSAQSVSMVKPLRCALWLRAFARQPINTARGLISHYVKEISLRVRPSVPWFAILGLDGSGKSTLLSGLQQRFAGIGLKTKVYHCRPKVLRLGPARSEPVTDPHGASPRHAFTALVKVPYLILDWFVGFFGPIASLRAKGAIVIFDRYHTDVLADPLRYRYSGAKWWLKAALSILPEPTAVVLLDADPKCLQLRKKETTIEAAKSIRLKYLDIIRGSKHAFIVDATKDRITVLDTTFSRLLAAASRWSESNHKQLN